MNMHTCIMDGLLTGCECRWQVIVLVLFSLFMARNGARTSKNQSM